jgi:tRNA(fMet)-specific endonuclease VapC
MTGNRVLIDTNIVIALFGGEATVKARLAATAEVWVPSTVIGELFYGARKSGRVAENVRRVEEFAAFNFRAPL